MIESASSFKTPAPPPAAEPPQPDPVEVSEVPFGDYILEKEIAHGGMGVVYRARTIAVTVDAETICLKCLDRNPQQRYPTADALAEELQRFLEVKPILARPVTRAEKALKWARRQPLLLVVALITTLTVAN